MSKRLCAGFLLGTALVTLSASADTQNLSGFWTTPQGNHLRVLHDPNKRVGSNLTIALTVDSDDTGRRTVTFEGFASPGSGGAVRLFGHAEPFPIMVNGKRCTVTDSEGIGAFGPTFDGTGVMIGEVGGRRIHMEDGCYFAGEIRCSGSAVGAWGSKCDGVWR
jgi:hypothetical protein